MYGSVVTTNLQRTKQLQPAARDPTTKFPLDDITSDIDTIPEEELIAYGDTAPILHQFDGVKVVRLSQKLVLKHGDSVSAAEGETMKYVETTFPGLRLPKAYRYFDVDESFSYFGIKGYIVMDFIDGLSLDKSWDQLDPRQQENVVSRVAAIVKVLQSKRFDSPRKIGGGMSRGRWFTAYSAGPFATKEEFEKWFNWKLKISKDVHQAPADIPEFNYSYFVLIHGDISPRNIILDASDEVWLIDWGHAGIYPAIFEAANIKEQVQFSSFGKMLAPLVYNDPDEMRQLKSIVWGISVAGFCNPP